MNEIVKEYYLAHHGILGQKWGVRRYQNKDGTLTAAGKKRYDQDYAENPKKDIIVNADGSKTMPKGFTFNRVGQEQMDVNKGGSLYVSYGKEDAARYVKNIGPTTLNKLLGTYGTTVQHISAKEKLKMPSEEQVAKATSKFLLENEKFFKDFKDSIYSWAIDENLSKDLVKKTLDNPADKKSKKVAYAVNSLLGDPNYSDFAQEYYSTLRKIGYDAIPDLHDQYSGTSNTAIVVINPNKLKITSTTSITKDTMKSAKAYVKKLEKLKVSDVLK